jgi:hypothetical protein
MPTVIMLILFLAIVIVRLEIPFITDIDAPQAVVDQSLCLAGRACP